MPTYFQNPENALKRANEFYEVGKKDNALEVLIDVIKSKKHRTWHKIHELIMEKFVTLCVELSDSQTAKEGLYQYRNICQQVNIKSLDHVMSMYLKLAEEKTEDARKHSHQQAVDLDDIQTPEKLLLCAVSGEDSQDRNDRAILTPWLKFTWESFRQCLDLLRNNPDMEKLYQDIAQKAMKFCFKYSRKTEFRKLCENIRNHLKNNQNQKNAQRCIDLSNPESLSLHLETRFAQLECAIQMELWQEAFKAVEDIHSLLVLTKKQPKPSLMANYYHKLALILHKSGNGLFHACALHRLYHLCKEQKKNITESEVQKLASRVLCATLAIPLLSGRYQNDHIIEVDDSGLEKQKNLAALMFYKTIPSRTSLLNDVLKRNIIQHVHPELKDLYNLLEVEFHPTELANKVQTCLEFLASKEDFAPYVPVLQDVTIVRFLKQISQVYQTISLPNLYSMVPFADNFHIERLIVDAVKNNCLKASFNHQHNHLSFEKHIDLYHEDRLVGVQVQCTPSMCLRNHLINMANALQKSLVIISPENNQEIKDGIRAQILKNYRQSLSKMHEHMLHRKELIERRTEEKEEVAKKEIKEQQFIEEQKRKEHEAVLASLNKEVEEREKRRKMEEHNDIQKKVARERIEQLKTTSVGIKAFANLSDEQLANMGMDDILAKQVEHLEKEKKEKEEKLKAQEKKVDHFERAKCLEEIPLLQKKYEEDSVADRILWEETEKERIQELINERKLTVAHKERMIHMKDDMEEFLERIKAERMSVYKEKLNEFEKVLNEERKKLLLERKEKRKEERRLNYYKEREERIQRKKDEELRRQKEEQEREAQAKKEQEEKEYKEKMKKLAEIEEKKRQIELEIEERERKRTEELTKPTSTWRDAPPKENAWKKRQDLNDKDVRGPKDDRDADRFRGDRDTGRFNDGNQSSRDWRTPRNVDSTKKEDSWRRDTSPKRTDAWRSQSRRDDPVKSDSWRSQRNNPPNNRFTEKNEEPKPKAPTKPEESDGWRTARR